MTIRVIGDVHGKVEEYVKLLHRTEAEGINKTVQIGDFGFKENYDFFENVMTEHLQRDEWVDSLHEFFPGNHDDYDNLPTKKEIEGLELDWCWGDFGLAPDGFSGSIFFVRGAKSIDKNQRTPGRDWWPEEELNWHQMNQCVEAYQKANCRVLLSHTTGYHVAKKLFPNARSFTSQTPKLIDRLFDVHRPEIHIFGHWHRNVVDKIGGTLCICLDELSYVDVSFNDKGEPTNVDFQGETLM